MFLLEEMNQMIEQCEEDEADQKMQEREKYEFQNVNRLNDERVFMTDNFLYGIRARVNAGFGLWQLAHASREALNAANYAAIRAQMQTLTGDQGRPLARRNAKTRPGN